ncbi:uncharacterized protein A1O5_03031 [Cladophialophora psammophila CBS 110553]|uniref:Uncharacterized protein n=1 Tax=Cladophialophora psammophila CBS 110553 TaxID=1182543 RepID=W9X8M0_9EURO|nr:uncharacterized protein A1O5_03031 [Cladophialophora psammophila CBS 110553]EXJ73271.1 hypothetical protein A1O5_03031 [Cladophialophora psammophila CBS 110553]
MITQAEAHRLDLPWLVKSASGAFIRPHLELQAFVSNELDVDILDDLEPWLWLAGRIDNIAPLHHQLVRGRRVVITERMKFHLLWHGDTIFIKPLPTWILDEDFCRRTTYHNETLKGRRYGFCKTYLWLIQYRSDFILAQELHLLPSSMSWDEWQRLVREKCTLLSDPSVSTSPRFLRGELRLSRVNMLYRYLPRYKLHNLFRGYFYGSASYKDFVRHHFGWLLVACLLMTLVLGALQLGIATEELRNNSQFSQVSYGFTISCLTVVFGATLCAVTASVAVTIYNVRAAVNQTRPNPIISNFPPTSKGGFAV